MNRNIRTYFIKHVLPKKWFRLSLLVAFICLGVILYITKQTPEIDQGKLDILTTEKKIQQDVLAFYKEDSAEVPASAESYITAEETVNYFFSIAKLEEEQFFPTVFLPKVYENDFFKFPIENRLSKVEEAMSRITRNNKLTEVEIIRNLWVMKKDSTRIVVDLYYEDLQDPIRINFVLRKIELTDDHEHGEPLDVYYVGSSVWEIIRSIES